jgi:hypothetical protein
LGQPGLEPEIYRTRCDNHHTADVV